MATKTLTETQRQLAKTLDIASNICIAYSAPTVPELGNLTKEGLLEEFGRMNEARKAMEKYEKVIRGRLESQLGGAKELRGDNYVYKKETTERTALNQEAAKAYFAEQGTLPDFMDTTDVDRVTVKRV